MADSTTELNQEIEKQRLSNSISKQCKELKDQRKAVLEGAVALSPEFGAQLVDEAMADESKKVSQSVISRKKSSQEKIAAAVDLESPEPKCELRLSLGHGLGTHPIEQAVGELKKNIQEARQCFSEVKAKVEEAKSEGLTLTPTVVQKAVAQCMKPIRESLR